MPAVGKKELKEFVDTQIKAFKAHNASVDVLTLDNHNAASEPKIAERFKNVTGLWLAGNELSNFARTYRDSVVSREMQHLLGRGGVIGAEGSVAEILGRTTIGLDGQGFDLLPDVIIDPDFSKPGAKDQLLAALKRHPGLVGIGIRDEACLVLKGRDASVIGEAGVAFCIPSSPFHQNTTFELTSKRVGDFTHYRRVARSRIQSPVYPPNEVPIPEVAKGSLVIVGGGGMPAEITKKFIELVGGPEFDRGFADSDARPDSTQRRRRVSSEGGLQECQGDLGQGSQGCRKPRKPEGLKGGQSDLVWRRPTMALRRCVRRNQGSRTFP